MYCQRGGHSGHFQFSKRRGFVLCLTKGDLSRVRGVDGHEEVGHAQLGHAQRRLQDDRKLRLRDGAVLLALKHLKITAHRKT